MNTPLYLTARQLCTVMHVSERTLVQWLKSGMPFFVIAGLLAFDLTQCLDWFERQEGVRV